MRFFVFLVGLLLPSSISWPVSWTTNPANGHLYSWFDSNRWTDAENIAVAEGGHLVTINNATENDWVFQWLQTDTPADVYKAWIGLYQLPGSPEPAGGWVWSSGEFVTYTNWQLSTGEPNNYQGQPEDFALMYARQHDWDENPSYWNDTLETFPWYRVVGVVEKNPEPVPEADVLVLVGLGCLVLWRYRRMRPEQRRQ